MTIPTGMPESSQEYQHWNVEIITGILGSILESKVPHTPRTQNPRRNLNIYTGILRSTPEILGCTLESQDSPREPRTHIPISRSILQSQDSHWNPKVLTGILRSSLKFNVSHWNCTTHVTFPVSKLEYQDSH